MKLSVVPAYQGSVIYPISRSARLHVQRVVITRLFVAASLGTH